MEVDNNELLRIIGVKQVTIEMLTRKVQTLVQENINLGEQVNTLRNRVEDAEASPEETREKYGEPT